MNRLADVQRRARPAFLTPDRSEAVEMAVDTRRVTRKRVPQDPRKRTVRYVEEAGGTRLRVGGTRLRVAQ